MKHRVAVVATISAFLCVGAVAQSKSESETPVSVVVKAEKLLDVRKGTYARNAAIWIEGERIKQVGSAVEVQGHAPKTAKIIDLGSSTILPGLIDCHTHIMSREAEGPNSYIVTLATKSQAFRALEGAYNARITLEAG